MKKVIKLIIIIVLIITLKDSFTYHKNLNEYAAATGRAPTIEVAKEYDQINGYKTIYLD